MAALFQAGLLAHKTIYTVAIMCDSYAHPAPRDEEQTEVCAGCGNEWNVQGWREYGMWSPINEQDMKCPGCVRNVLEG